MTNHALAFANSVTAQCGSPSLSASPTWLQLTQAASAIATTIGVLIALYIALIREPREAFEAHKHHIARMGELRRMKNERFGAQARKLVPSCARTSMLGDTSWAVRIDNASTKATTILSVAVDAVDTNGVEVPDGTRSVHHGKQIDP